jgi:hypothetical protein
MISYEREKGPVRTKVYTSRVSRRFVYYDEPDLLGVTDLEWARQLCFGRDRISHSRVASFL